VAAQGVHEPHLRVHELPRLGGDGVEAQRSATVAAAASGDATRYVVTGRAAAGTASGAPPRPARPSRSRTAPSPPPSMAAGGRSPDSYASTAEAKALAVTREATTAGGDDRPSRAPSLVPPLARGASRPSGGSAAGR
jgi:hypothetical protein